LASGAVRESRNQYLIAATIVWVAIWVATGAVADDEFNDLIPILGGGTVNPDQPSGASGRDLPLRPRVYQA
jgi:hypothetical protein